MMTLIDYGSQYTGSTMSSDTNSEGAVSRQTRVRTVRLVRPQTHTLPPPSLTCRHGPSLGFSITGGREHGTGIFVSQVEPGSEAHRQGLMAGDQIVRVNGFAVDDAVHKEVLQLISNHTHLILKVRSVGMIPVKEKRTDSLSWHIISDCNSSIRSSPPLQEKIQDVRITIMVAPRQKLGCGICKGPDWKPGIFIQFTKDGGVAREAGLRPGDQILLCNSVDFTDIAFNEAVNIMKSSRQLDLVVRKSVGTELFPGESSGYNSSASSVTGDQSPSWSDSKRLSIVKEESMDLEDRLNHYDRFKTKKWEKIEWDEDSDSQHQNKPIYQYKPTIINLSENGTTITNNCPDIYSQEDENTNGFNTVVNKKKLLADICLVSHQHQHETKTVLVEVHRSDLEAKEQQQQNQGPGGKLVKSPSNASVASSSLSSAISQEILRRSEKVKPTLSIDDQLQKRKILKNVDDDKQQQHSKLMDEFKRAHKKMFKNNGEENGTQNTEDRQLKNRVGNENGDDGRLNVVSSLNSSSSSNGNSFGNEAVQMQAQIQAQQQQQQGKVISASTTPSNSTPTKPNNGQSLLLPPPPPPLPQGEKRNGGGNVATSTTTTTDVSASLTNNKAVKPKAPPPPPPIKTSTLSFHQPPPCPTPDYDNLSINSQSNLNHNTHNTLTRKGGLKNGNASQNDKVEMDSLDSYKLNQPAEVSHKPPSTYFPLKKQVVNSNTSTLNRNPNPNQNQNNNNGTLTKPRPVSVVIGEYPSGTLRPTPRKLDFLQQNSNSMDKTDGASQQQQLIDKFTSELSQTLSRSNLRKKTESVTNGHQ